VQEIYAVTWQQQFCPSVIIHVGRRRGVGGASGCGCVVVPSLKENGSSYVGRDDSWQALGMHWVWVQKVEFRVRVNERCTSSRHYNCMFSSLQMQWRGTTISFINYYPCHHYPFSICLLSPDIFEKIIAIKENRDWCKSKRVCAWVEGTSCLLVLVNEAMLDRVQSDIWRDGSRTAASGAGLRRPQQPGRSRVRLDPSEPVLDRRRSRSHRSPQSAQCCWNSGRVRSDLASNADRHRSWRTKSNCCWPST